VAYSGRPGERSLLFTATGWFGRGALMAAVAEFENVVKDYARGPLGGRKLRALDGVTLSIDPGQVFGLLGPNRAGKTTLVKLLLSLCRPTGGRVARLGRPLSDRGTLARFGYVHENHAFPRYLTPTGLLEFYGALSLVPPADVRRRTPELLERVGLADRAGDSIAGFSKGMKQRLGIAQALINDPEVLVLDEPNEGLDLLGRRLMAGIVREARERGRTVILVSHVLPEVEQLCDRVAVLARGKLAFSGTTAELARGTDGTPRTLEDALAALYEGGQ
jgi:ABC-2 type transport system ATP-binding protein